MLVGSKKPDTVRTLYSIGHPLDEGQGPHTAKVLAGAGVGAAGVGPGRLGGGGRIG